jgi:tungstate transport system substrate-binding protein
MERLAGAVLALALAVNGPAKGADEKRYIVLASTTSTEQTGLFNYLLERFEASADFRVRVVAVGTGQALDIAKRGDADLVLVHDRELEDRFVADGHGIDRRDVMYNEVVLVGPNTDPALAAGTGAGAAARALKRIAQAQAVFVSRGDRSGTHAAELRIWRAAGLAAPTNALAWYRDVGAGMGQALNLASAMNGYVIADRGSWIAFKNRGQLGVVVEADPALRNQYGVILVNPARHPHVKVGDARRFIGWLISADGQQQIANFRIGGEVLFFPGAAKLP